MPKNPNPLKNKRKRLKTTTLLPPFYPLDFKLFLGYQYAIF
jgi:hypothetical protein